MLESTLVMIVVVAVFLLNALVCVFLLRRKDLDRFQKSAQIVIVWLVPVVGALVFWFISRAHDQPVAPQNRPFGGGAGTQAPASIRHESSAD